MMFSKTKKVIKWENVIITFYTIITLFKYFITSNDNILILILDLILDFNLGISIHYIIYIIRKRDIIG